MTNVYKDYNGLPIEDGDAVLILSSTYSGVPCMDYGIVTGFTPKQVRVTTYDGTYKAEFLYKTTHLVCIDKFLKVPSVVSNLKAIKDKTAPTYEEYAANG